MVRAEWDLLREGLDALADDVRAAVDARIAELALLEREGTLPRHVVCPMLDHAEGACRVYAHRPGACRTYGFYVERGIGLHCHLVSEAVAERPADEVPVVWGNVESVDYALARLRDDGCEEPLPLTAWALSSPLCEPSSPSSAM